MGFMHHIISYLQALNKVYCALQQHVDGIMHHIRAICTLLVYIIYIISILDNLSTVYI